MCGNKGLDTNFYVVTKIKNRVEDNRLFKFLAIQDEDRIYQVGLSIDTLIISNEKPDSY